MTTAQATDIGPRGTSIIPRDRVERYSTQMLTSEASDCGIRPGLWPRTIILDGAPDENGIAREGFDYIAGYVHDGDLLWVHYGNGLGTILRIFND